MKVLVVDDEPHSRDLLERLLAECGAQVRSASDAGDAMAQLRTFVPHVLISDIGMPDTDGYELLKMIRDCPVTSLRSIPAIALTAFARVEDRDRSLGSGFNAHITKPMDPAELLAVVDRLARRRSGGGAPRSSSDGPDLLM